MLPEHVQQCGANGTLGTADDDAAGFEVETMHGTEIFAQLSLHSTFQIVQASTAVGLAGYATGLLHCGKIFIMIDNGQGQGRWRYWVAESNAVVEFEAVRGFLATCIDEQFRRCDALLPLRAVEKTKFLCQVYVEPFATVGTADRSAKRKIIHDER